ncbi:MAG TPA: alpha/beta hydrolase-fold protein [Kiritimatiellia bacterium]|nr:alpha/beta hydrolase-fold protein [Kiritimatiellia bacterium]HMP34083.1 alpha/beta hydrolase-fold protein [Kiritimatiellia bacterium]
MRTTIGWGVLGAVITVSAWAGRPPLHTVTVSVSSNAGAGSALYLAVDRPELNRLTTTGAVRMVSPSANQWTVSVAVQGSTVATSATYRLTARTTSSATHCTPGNGNLAGASFTTNLPLWNPGYTGKTVFYRTSWTNAFILFRVGESETFSNAPMARIGAGRAAGEFLYRVDGIGEAGRPLEFVPNGYNVAGVQQWDNPASGGVNNNYYTPLDTLFVQDGQIYNYTPPATVSAPQVISVTAWNSSYTGNGIPTRGGRIYLPRGYTQNTTKRYPVLYMHDGQNVFDPGGAFGSWSADAAATREIMHGRMRETIIVAVNNSNNRMSEYGTPQDGYTGDYYLRYLVHNVKPAIDAAYRTLTNRMDTGVMGSSLGGLISAYCGLSTNVYGLIGAVSPSYWYGPNFRTWISAQPTKGVRIWQCAGASEGASMWDHFWPVLGYYQQDGYVVNDDLRYAIGCGEGHNEAAWANRVPGAFRFLLHPWDEANTLETNAAPSPGTVQFESASHTVSETSGVARVWVTRLGGTAGGATVQVATVNGSALAGSDFTAVNTSLAWTNGDGAAKFIDVPLINDALYELTESFTLALSFATGASLGTPGTTTVTVLDNDPAPPDIVVTNPPGATLTVAAETGAIDLAGVANPYLWPYLAWTNARTGAAGALPATLAWSIAGVALAEGTNVITVTASNTIPVIATNATDRGANAAYGDGWTEADNGGSGFGAWVLTTSTTNVNNNGRFMATSAAVDIGTPAWGLYANNDNLSEARRLFAAPLAPGQTLRVSLDNGFIDTGRGIGIAVQNDTNATLWEFYFNGGDATYSINGAATDIGWTSTGIDLELTLTGPTQYLARITPRGGTVREIAGNLIPRASTAATRFRAWNYSAGSGSDYDVFFNHLELVTRTAAGSSTGATVAITRPSGWRDGIPLSWWNQYGLGTNETAGGDSDGDGATHFEEYIAGTHPGQAASVFTNRIAAAEGTASLVLQAGPPTTNTRVYAAWFSTNLSEGVWQRLGGGIPGASNGGAVWIGVTNSGAGGFYRTAVELP